MEINYGNVQLKGVDFNNPTFKMVGGMSIDDIKIKYNWFLNAEVKDAIIGEDENGLVWYNGEWICGTWENGTWYSGLWHNGRWKDGQWYSYDINIDEVLKGNLSIIRKDINKSKFISGSWEGGTFNYGIFGLTNTTIDIPTKPDLDYIITYNTDYDLSGDTYYYYKEEKITIETDSGYTTSTVNVIENINSPVLKNGEIKDGWINAAKITGGNFYNGFLNNSLWYNGNFYNGYFLGDIWYDGNFYGGDFSNGTWKNGKLSIFDENIKTRFGLDYKKTGAIWENGIFLNGEFYSRINIENGEIKASEDNNLVKWYNGNFYNGIWYGGTWYNGTWDTGTFHYGIIYNITWNRGTFLNGLWYNGIFKNGTIVGGLFENINILDGNIGYNI